MRRAFPAGCSTVRPKGYGEMGQAPWGPRSLDSFRCLLAARTVLAALMQASSWAPCRRGPEQQVNRLQEPPGPLSRQFLHLPAGGSLLPPERGQARGGHRSLGSCASPPAPLPQPRKALTGFPTWGGTCSSSAKHGAEEMPGTESCKLWGSLRTQLSPQLCRLLGSVTTASHFRCLTLFLYLNNGNVGRGFGGHHRAPVNRPPGGLFELIYVMVSDKERCLVN